MAQDDNVKILKFTLIIFAVISIEGLNYETEMSIV